MLDYTEFKKNLIEKLSETFNIEEKKVPKNNSLILDGLILNEKGELNGTRISPTVYVERFYDSYKEGKEIDQIVNEIISLADKPKPDFNVDSFSDWEQMKHRIVMALVNYHDNKEQLDNMAYMPYLDLAVIFKVVVEDGVHGDSRASIKVLKEHMNMWGVTEVDLFNAAKENTAELNPPTIKGMAEIMIGMGMPPEMVNSVPDTGMIVVGNENSLDGASSVLLEDAMDEVAKRFNADKFFVIPSSIHEAICVPYEDATPDELTEMIMSVNSSEVRPEERLSNHAYVYSTITKELTNA